jgi:L-aminopeptidase/D-esterase-like protein
MNTTLTAVPGVKVGHAQNEEALTGCTVIVCESGATGGVDQRGGAPGTRETDLLRPVHLVENVHAILLTGGSAYGLDAAGGVMKYLEERRIGFNVGATVVPIVPAAVIFDLTLGRPDVRPDAAMGYAACISASTEPVVEGNVGVGTGATVGKVMGHTACTKSGLGTAHLLRPDGLKVYTLVVVNAFGDIVDGDGKVLAGARTAEGGFLDTESFLAGETGFGEATTPGANTTLGIIVTNARLSKTDVNWVAQRGHNGLARSIIPSHTKLDGDLIFAAATGEVETSADLVGIVGARLMAQAVRNAARAAVSVAGIPACRDLLP